MLFTLPSSADPVSPFSCLKHLFPSKTVANDRPDSRFFIVKSFNEDNVRRCMDDVSTHPLQKETHPLTTIQGLWTTQVQNGEILTEAYAKCKNVILFFSINKSRAFQGYVSHLPAHPRPHPSHPSQN